MGLYTDFFDLLKLYLLCTKKVSEDIFDEFMSYDPLFRCLHIFFSFENFKNVFAITIPYLRGGLFLLTIAYLGFFVCNFRGYFYPCPLR